MSPLCHWVLVIYPPTPLCAESNGFSFVLGFGTGQFLKSSLEQRLIYVLNLHIRIRENYFLKKQLDVFFIILILTK